MMLTHGIPPVILAGIMDHSIAVLMHTYTHQIPTLQNHAAQLMANILTPIPIVYGFGGPRWMRYILLPGWLKSTGPIFFSELV
jgi:hypothetical protein